jgi:hypothetical protein
MTTPATPELQLLATMETTQRPKWEWEFFKHWPSEELNQLDQRRRANLARTRNARWEMPPSNPNKG